MVEASSFTTMISIAGIILAMFIGIQVIDALDSSSLIIGTSLDLTPNSNIVPVSGYTALSGVSGTGSSGTVGDRTILMNEHDSRIRQSGIVVEVEIETGSEATDASLTGVHFQVWRHDGVNWDLIDETSNLVTEYQALGNSVQGTISLTDTNQMTAQEGDYMAIKITSTTATVVRVLGNTVGDSTPAIYWQDGTLPTTDYDWTGQNTGTTYIKMQYKMIAPSIVFIGDSITSGHPQHGSYITDSTLDDHTSTISYKTGQSLNVPTQNVGIGGQTASDGNSRFSTDVIALSPKVVVIAFGSNDISNSVTVGTFSSNTQSMITAAQNAGITPVLQKIYPRDYDTIGVVDAKDTERLAFNTELDNLATINNISIIDTDIAVGDGNNPLGIAAAYDSGDNVHFNEAGHTQIASAVASTINSGGTTSLAETGENVLVFAGVLYSIAAILIILFVIPLIRGTISQKA